MSELRYAYRTCEKCGEKEYRYPNQSCNYCECQDCDLEDSPRCPYCFRPYADWTEHFGGPGNGDGQEDEIECGNCCETFKATMHVSYAFDTEKINAKAGDE